VESISTSDKAVGLALKGSSPHGHVYQEAAMRGNAAPQHKTSKSDGQDVELVDPEA